jgi:hypothetical protein
MNITLQLKCTAEPQRSPDAWWLPGDSVAMWVREVVTWPIAQNDLRLLSVPGDFHGTTSGALVITPTKDAAAILACRPAGVAYSLVGNRLYVPRDAVFDPPAADAEIAALVPEDDAIYVWQPARGLIRCDQFAERRLDQLLALPSQKANTWNQAVPGTALNDRLLSIEPFVVPEIDQFLNMARGDIGTLAPEIQELPYSPNERRWWRRIVWLVIAGVLLVIVFLVLFRGASVNWPLVLMAIAVALVIMALLWRLAKWAKETATRNKASRPAANSGRSSAGGGGCDGSPRRSTLWMNSWKPCGTVRSTGYCTCWKHGQMKA